MMKPRKPLVQRTPITRKTPLRNGAALKSSGPVKPRRYKLSAEEGSAKESLGDRSGGWCEIQADGVCQGRAREWSHRKPKAHCAPEELWVLSNGLHACGHGNLDGCHGLVHQRPVFARSQGWAVRSKLVPALRPAHRRGVLVWLLDDGSVEPLDFQELAEWVA